MKKSHAAVIALTGFASLAFALSQASAVLAAGPGAVPPAGNVVPTFNGLNILPTNNIKLSIDPTSGYIGNDSGSSFVIFNDPQGIGLNNGAGITGVGQNVIFKDSGPGTTKIDALIPIFNSAVVSATDQPVKIADGAGLQLANDSGTPSLQITGTLGNLSNQAPGLGVTVSDSQGFNVANDSGVNVFSISGADGSIRRPDASYPLRIADNNGFEIANEASSVFFKLAGTGDLLHPAGTIFNPHITGGVDDPISISDKLKVTTTAGPAVEATGLTGGRFANTLGTNTVNLGTATAAVDAVGIIKNAGLSIAANGDISTISSTDSNPVKIIDSWGVRVEGTTKGLESIVSGIGIAGYFNSSGGNGISVTASGAGKKGGTFSSPGNAVEAISSGATGVSGNGSTIGVHGVASSIGGVGGKFETTGANSNAVYAQASPATGIAGNFIGGGNLTSVLLGTNTEAINATGVIKNQGLTIAANGDISDTGDVTIADNLYTSGNVGIGNNSPSYKLHVTGSTNIDGALTADSIGGYYFRYSPNANLSNAADPCFMASNTKTCRLETAACNAGDWPISVTNGSFSSWSANAYPGIAYFTTFIGGSGGLGAIYIGVENHATAPKLYNVRVLCFSPNG